MIRTVLRSIIACLLLVSVHSLALGQPATPGPGKNETPQGQSAPATSAGVMQLKKQITGDFSYRFVPAGDKTGNESAVTSPTPLPAASGTDNVVAIAIPSSVNIKDSVLEVLDNARGNLARLPVSTKGIVPLTESSFTVAQRVNVPVQSKGLGVIGAQVTMTAPTKKFSQTRLLQPDDAGVARFDNVPLNEPVTVSVTYAGNPAESQTKTLTTTRTSDAWPPISVTWPDAKTIPAPAVVQPTTSNSHESSNSQRSSDEDSHHERQPESNPLTSLVQTIVSLIFLCAVGYGVFWAYKTGRIKTALDKLGINTAPMATTVGTGDPFAKPAKTPIQPITEGVADPFGGSGVVGLAAAAPIASGPRLVATAGTYAGSIFPLNGPMADIGRDAGNAIPMPNDTNASRRHATIQGANGQFTLVDNGSSNGTFVNGVRIASQTPQTLRPGDEVQIGMTRFRFEA